MYTGESIVLSRVQCTQYGHATVSKFDTQKQANIDHIDDNKTVHFTVRVPTKRGFMIIGHRASHLDDDIRRKKCNNKQSGATKTANIKKASTRKWSTRQIMRTHDFISMTLSNTKAITIYPHTAPRAMILCPFQQSTESKLQILQIEVSAATLMMLLEVVLYDLAQRVNLLGGVLNQLIL